MPRSATSDIPDQRPTLRQVAEKAGVSAMTVSRALRNSPRVTAALRKRIQKIADGMGYRPDPEVTKLMSHLRRRDKAQMVASIAAITSMPEDIEQSQLRKVCESARIRAAELGYSLELFRVADPTVFNRSLERTLINRGIEGVLLMQLKDPGTMDGFLSWEKFSAALVSPSVLGPDFPRVGVNHYHNARLLCERLALRGCKRIGFLGSATFSVRTNEAFIAAAVWQCIAAGETPVRPLIFRALKDVNTEFIPWLKRERPDAVIAHGEIVLPALVEKLAAYSGPPILLTCTSVNPATTICPGIDERNELIGRKAVDVLSGLLNRNEKNFRTTHSSTLIAGQWVEPVPRAKGKAK